MRQLTPDEIELKVACALETLHLNHRMEVAAQISPEGVQNARKIIKKYPAVAKSIWEERDAAMTRCERGMW